MTDVFIRLLTVVHSSLVMCLHEWPDDSIVFTTLYVTSLQLYFCYVMIHLSFIKFVLFLPQSFIMNDDRFVQLQLQIPSEEELLYCDCGMYLKYCHTIGMKCDMHISHNIHRIFMCSHTLNVNVS